MIVPDRSGQLQFGCPIRTRASVHGRCRGGLSRRPKLLDHLVGAREHACRQIKAERVGSLEVDDELVLHRRLHRQVRRTSRLSGCGRHSRRPAGTGRRNRGRRRSIRHWRHKSGNCRRRAADIARPVQKSDRDEPSLPDFRSRSGRRSLLARTPRCRVRFRRHRARRSDCNSTRDRRRDGLDGAELAGPGCDGGFANDRRPREAGRDFLEQLQPFPAHAVFEVGEAGGVAARLCQTTDEAGTDRLGDSVNTTGMVWVAFSKGATAALEWARMTSGASATNSAACLRMASASPAPQR